MTGKLIVFEGAEGVGKSTQLRLLAEWLESRGQDVVAVREPGGTILGDEIRRILLDPSSEIAPRAEALLFMASRAELVEREIRPALGQSLVVLVDRFFLSTYAYQCAGRGLPQDEVRAANKLATGGLVPDVTLLLTLPVTEGLARAEQRGAPDRMERASDDFHYRVASAFTQFATAEWQRAHPECGPIVSIDARGSERDVFARVQSELARRWPGSSFGEGEGEGKREGADVRAR
jgi:dTMP kinase